MIARFSIYSLLIFFILSFLVFPIPSIVYPFIIAFVLSYLLNPLVLLLYDKYGIPRSLSAFMVTFSILVVIGAIILYCGPILYAQMEVLIGRIPHYKDYLSKNVIPLVAEKLSHLEPSISNKIKVMIDQSVNAIFNVFLVGFHNIWGYTMATFHLLFFIILIPVLLFFFLRDWTSINQEFYNLFPKYQQTFVKGLFNDIDRVLGAYLRGLVIVCIILATYYTTAFHMASLDLAVLLGILAGVGIVLPFIGGIISICTSLLVVHFTYGFDVHTLYVLSIYGFGSILENVFLTPKIVGDSIGLNPAWIIFAVLMFGYIAGPAGMLIAIPTTAVIAVILRHIISDYKKSKIYNTKGAIEGRKSPADEFARRPKVLTSAN